MGEVGGGGEEGVGTMWGSRRGRRRGEVERGDRRWGEVGGREKGKWGCNSWEVEGSTEYMYVVHTFITLTHHSL